MAESLINFHGLLKYAVVFVITMVCVFSFYNWRNAKPYTKFHEIISRVNIGIIHLQMLIGIIVLTHSSKVSYASLSLFNNPYAFWSIIHPLLMFGGIMGVTLALMLVRNDKPGPLKHRLIFILNAFALLCVCIGLFIIPSQS